MLQLTVRAVLALAASTAMAVVVTYAVALFGGAVNVVTILAISILLWTPAIVGLLLAERSQNQVVATVLVRSDRAAVAVLALMRRQDRDA